MLKRYRNGLVPAPAADLAPDAEKTIAEIQEDRIGVQYLDGPERMLTPELIKRYDLRVGMSIECRWSAGPHYFPGKIDKLDGERVRIEYDDGEDEWTSIRLVRLPPKQ